MKNKIILIIFLLSPFTVLYSQTVDTIPFTLTKRQMREDLKQLANLIQTYSAQYGIRKQQTGYDMTREIQHESRSLKKINNYWEFVFLLERCLNKTLDVHASMREDYFNIPFPWYYPGQSFYDSSHIRTIYDGYESYIGEIVMKKKMMITHLSMNTYIDGDYYAHGLYKFYHKKTGDSLILENFKILEYDHSSVDQFVLTQIGLLPAFGVRWDYRYKKYYTDWLALELDKKIKVLDYRTKQEHIFTPEHFNLVISGISIPDIQNNMDYYFSLRKQQQDQVVKYFENDEILYIYTKFMRGNEIAFCDSIKTIGKDKNIKKIIIDVRDNSGGGDEYWKSILSCIVKDTLYYEAKIALNNNSIVLDYFSNEYPSDFSKEFQPIYIPILNTKMLARIESERSIIPDSNSLCFSGNIYIFQDENTYSSAHSLTSLARQIPQLISIGLPTGNIAGFGFNPWGFQLKNSKFTFQFETAIDISKLEKNEDVFQDIPEIEIYPSLPEFLEYEEYGNFFDKQSEYFLFNHDYLFNKILKIE